MAVYPVCGTEVAEKKARGTSDFNGKRYYFCSRVCKKKFDESPEKFTRK
jgi:YHS domain-containing protein